MSETKKTLKELSDEQLKIKHNIKKMQDYLENEEVQNSEMFEELLKEYFEVQANNKDILKQKANSICYLVKKFQNEIELDKAIAAQIAQRRKSKENKIDFLKEYIRHYLNMFGMLDETLRLDYFTVYQGTSKDSIEYDEKQLPFELQKEEVIRKPDTEKIREFLKNNPKTKWGRCFDKQYLVIRGGKVQLPTGDEE